MTDNRQMRSYMLITGQNEDPLSYARADAVQWASNDLSGQLEASSFSPNG